MSKDMGVGAMCSVKAKLLLPAAIVKARLLKEPFNCNVNSWKEHVVEDLNVIGEDLRQTTRRSGTERDVWILSHKCFDDQEIYAIKSHCKYTPPKESRTSTMESNGRASMEPFQRPISRTGQSNDATTPTAESTPITSLAAFSQSTITLTPPSNSSATAANPVPPFASSSSSLQLAFSPLPSSPSHGLLHTNHIHDVRPTRAIETTPVSAELDGIESGGLQRKRSKQSETSLVQRHCPSLPENAFTDQQLADIVASEGDELDDMEPVAREAADLADAPPEQVEETILVSPHVSIGSRPAHAQNRDSQEDVDCNSDDDDPDPSGPRNYKGYTYGAWRDSRTTADEIIASHKPRLHLRTDYHGVTPIGVFLSMMPMDHLIDVVVPFTNTNISREARRAQASDTNPTFKALTVHELLQFFALIMSMASHSTYTREEFWSTLREKTAMFNPPFFGIHMTKNRFNCLMGCLEIADPDDAPTEFQDSTWKARALQQAFNDNMRRMFTPGTFVCLDESMVVWTNDSGPAFMYVQRKPHPFGNEYHTIACRDTKVVFHMELVEGRQRPSSLPPLEFSADFSKTTALVLRMTKSIWRTRRVVAMDSGFGVLPVLVELKKRDLYGTIVLKKHGRYWPRGCPGGSARALLKHAPIGTVKIKEELDKGFYILAFREARFISITAHSYGEKKELCDRERYRYSDPADTGGRRELVRVKYPKVLDEYYATRHCVDDNNNHRMARHAIDADGWRTRKWEHRQFAYILATAEANAKLMYDYLARKSHDKIEALPGSEFRRRLVSSLLSPNVYSSQVLSRRTRAGRSKDDNGSKSSPSKVLLDSAVHLEMVKPDYCGKYDRDSRTWTKVAGKYSPSRCSVSGCSARSRIYCKCIVGKILCRAHLHEHLSEAQLE